MSSRKSGIKGLFERIRRRRLLRLVERLGKPDHREALDALQAIGPPAVELLIGALDDPALRLGAIQALGRIGDRRGVEPLICLLGDKDAGEWAAKALELIGDLRAVKPLLELAWKDENDPYGMKLAFIDRLAWLGDAEALSKLELWVDKIRGQFASIVEKESDPLVKWGAAETIYPCIEGLERAIARIKERLATTERPG